MRVKTGNFSTYHTEYAINTFTSDASLRHQVANLLNEIRIIRVRLYERILLLGETRNLDEEKLKEIVCDISDHKISKVTANPTRWIEGKNFIREVVFSTSY